MFELFEKGVVRLAARSQRTDRLQLCVSFENARARMPLKPERLENEVNLPCLWPCVQT